MSQAIEIEADFAAVMQQLSAQAAGASPEEKMGGGIAQPPVGFSELITAVHGLGQRMETLEGSVLRKFEGLQLQQLQEDLAAIRDSESVNQKLFDSLHQELISYRDNFVRDSLQKPVIRDLLVLFDDLSAIDEQLGHGVGKGSRSASAQVRDNLSNALHFLIEILHRLEVNEIEMRETVDLKLHRVISYEPADVAEDDGRIVARVKRGFAWRERVLRPEEVIAKRFQ